MGLHEWYLKTFEKSKVIHAMVFTADRRVRNYFVIPQINNNVVEISCKQGTYFINDKDFHLDAQGFPTYIFTQTNRIPVDMTALKLYPDSATPDMYQTAINGHTAKDIIKSTDDKKMDAGMIAMVLGLVTLVGVIGIGYLVMQQAELIEEMRETLRIIGGI